MKNKFTFNEIVKIVGIKPSLKNITNEIGIVEAMVQDDETMKWYYGVYIHSTESVWQIVESDLVSTGKKAKKEDFYTGESIKVRVDPKTGEGEIVEDEES